MSEQAKAQTDQEKLEELNTKFSLAAHSAGTLAYNIQINQQEVVDKQVEMKNLVIDIKKLNKKMSEEAAAAPKPALVPEVVDVVQ